MARWTGEFGPDLPLQAFRRTPFKNGPATLEGGKGDAPAPDPRMGEAALKQIALAERQYEDYRTQDMPWIKQLANEAIGIQRANSEAARGLTQYQLDAMRRNDDRYWNVAVPFENRLLQDVNRFDSQAYKDQLVGQQLADVTQAFSNTRDQAARGLARMGVNPNSGRFAAMQNVTSIEQAKAMAAAANKTRQAADQIGLSTKMQMYGGMRGLAGLGATNAQLGAGAMGVGNQAAAGMLGSGISYSGANNAAFNASMAGMSAGVQGLGTYNQLQQNAAKINNDADPFGAILGAGAQLGAAWLLKPSDRRLKQDIVFVGVDRRTGLNLYEFSYKDGSGKRYIGVMADEVEKIYPEAVFTMPDGYKAVDYAKLGVELVEVPEAVV